MSTNLSSSRVLTLTLAAALLSGCKVSSQDNINYEASPVKRADIVQSVTASGTLDALVSVDVGCQISGRIQSLAADFNTEVKKGKVVAQIDPVIYQAALDVARGELENADASLELAKLSAARKQELVNHKAEALADLETANADLRKASATVLIRRAQVERAQADLGYCQIMAPVDGIVISRKVDVGQTVVAAMTTPLLFTIAQDITKMHIVASVSEADIGRVAVGQPVNFSVEAFPDETFHGTVAQVRLAATTNNNVVTYDTVIDVDNPQKKLFPGMTAEISIRVAERHNVLTVPNAALRFSPPEGAKFEGAESASKASAGMRRVYVLGARENVLKPITLKTGATDGLSTEVFAGTSEGDRIVTGAKASEKKPGGFGPPPMAQQ